ncbi:MAG: ABC transporter ATP-binding protein [Bacteroidales bacterium]|nr:ABC transporter ATP-binding protein [Bacteroidales bacterium]
MESLIVLRDIKKYYKVGNEVVKALNGISLSIKRNEYLAIMGASGSGKSTLMNILGCLDTPSDGEYFLNNYKVSDMADNELAEIRNKEIGFVFQSFNLLPRSSTLENVMLPLIYAGIKKEKRIETATHFLKSVGLSERMKHKPNELSGGQKQRVAIARALVNNPSIILADEPTGNLDSKISLEIMALLNKIHQDGNTVILVTHEDEIARFAHRIIRLKDGEIESDTINSNVVNPEIISV